MKLNRGVSDHPEHARYIANIIAQWNAIEDVAAKLLGIFLGADVFVASQLFASMASSHRLKLIDLTGQRFLAGKPLLGDFDALVLELDGRLQARNDYAHALYGVGDDGGLTILRRKFDLTKPARAQTALPLDELEAEWARCTATFNRAIEFHESLWKSLSPAHTQALHMMWLLQDGAKRRE